MKGHLEQALVHDTVETNELWHRKLAHVHYKALPIASKVVEGLPEIQEKHDEACKGCAKGIFEIIHSDICIPMSSSSLSGYVYYVSFIDYFF